MIGGSLGASSTLNTSASTASTVTASYSSSQSFTGTSVTTDHSIVSNIASDRVVPVMPTAVASKYSKVRDENPNCFQH
jgi:hypothetical protein